MPIATSTTRCRPIPRSSSAISGSRPRRTDRGGAALTFVAVGVATACWAPLAPYARTRLGVDDATFGLALLGLGAGSVAALPLAGALVVRLGARSVILGCGALAACVLPLLALAHDVRALAAALAAFGASLAATDVAMNAEGIEVEREAGVPILSGLHASFSLGGLLGAAASAAALAGGATPSVAALGGAVVVAALLAAASTRLPVRARSPGGPVFALPRGGVALLGALAFAAFLVEGAMLDWSAILTTRPGGLPVAEGGLAYAVFSTAMTAARLTGDRVVARLGRARSAAVGGSAVALGCLVLSLATGRYAPLGGCALVGLGAANLVPLLFAAAGRRPEMPSALALASVSTLGYAGILAGPALVGLVARGVGLPLAFAGLAVLALSFVPLRRLVA